MLRLIVAQPQALLRAGLVAILTRQPDLEVVGEAWDGEDALCQIAEHRPHVGVLDIALQRLSGVEVASRIRGRRLGTAVVLLAPRADGAPVQAGLEAGARGFVVAESGPHELLAAIRAVAAGGCYLSPRLSASAAAAIGAPGKDGAAKLTERERDVLRLVAEGRTSKEIGTRLGIAAKTVEGYRSEVMRRLRLPHIAGLVKYAIRHHLTSVEG